jgi:hypothetical protein
VGLSLGEFECEARIRLGTQMDGGWNVCLDPLVRTGWPQSRSALPGPLPKGWVERVDSLTKTAYFELATGVTTRDRPVLQGVAPSCLVYSFGIGNETSFDFAAAALGCEVHLFDPTLPSESEQKVANRMYFHPWGLASSDTVTPAGWVVKTLSSIAQRLGHANVPAIDIVKIDIEGDEWNVLPGLLASTWFADGRVKQFVIEAHLSANQAASQLRILAKLLQMGYALHARDYNWRYSGLIYVDGHLMMDCLELSYVYVGRSVAGAVSNQLPAKPVNAFWNRRDQGRGPKPLV